MLAPANVFTQGFFSFMTTSALFALERIVSGLGRGQLFLGMLAPPVVSEVVRLPKAFITGVTLERASFLVILLSLLLLLPSIRVLLSHVSVQSFLMTVRTAAQSAAV